MLNGFILAQTLTFVVVVLLFSLVVKVLTDSVHGVKENFRYNNPAYGLRVTSSMVSVAIALSGALNGVTSETYFAYLITLFRDGAIITFVLLAAQAVNEWLIVTQVDNSEAIAKKDLAVAITEVGGNIAAGILAFGAFHGGINGQLLPAIVFLALGLLVLVVAFHIFDFFHPADLLENVRKGQVPSGIMSGGLLVGIALILKTAIQGEFTSWGAGIGSFFGSAALGLVLLVFVQSVFCRYVRFIPNMGKETDDVTDSLIATGSLLSTATILSLVI